MRFKNSALVICYLALSSCTVADTTVTNPVTWYALNGWSDTVRFDMYDIVCDHRLAAVRLRPGDQVAITTCGNERGQASIRYRRERIAAAGRTWTTETMVRSGQELLLR